MLVVYHLSYMKFIKSLPSLFTKKKPVLVIVGPTASGKSSLAIEIAKAHNGEVISCDSRQIYRGLEIFSGAVTQQTSGGVKHHLVSFLQPGEIYSADLFVKQSMPIIDMLHAENKLPIITGGTGFWAQVLMYEKNFPAVAPDYQFRETLESHSTEELLVMLEQADPRRAKQADPHNRKRLIRALEIIESLGTVPVIRNVTRKGYSFILVYLRPEKPVLDERITQNVSQRIGQGLFKEAESALSGLSRKQVEELGLGFKHVFDLQEGSITEEEFIDEMTREEKRYSKRQKTFINKLYKNFTGKKVIIETLDQEERFTQVSQML